MRYRVCLDCPGLVALPAKRCERCSSLQVADVATRSAWRLAVLTRDGYSCVRCGLHDASGRGLEADHIRPLADGGALLAVSNGQTLCRACHAAKGAEDALLTGRTPGSRGGAASRGRGGEKLAMFGSGYNTATLISPCTGSQIAGEA